MYLLRSDFVLPLKVSQIYHFHVAHPTSKQALTAFEATSHNTKLGAAMG
jgi:hypothetical protein